MILVLPVFAAERGVREAHGDFANQLELEHVVLKWGPNETFSDDDVVALGDAFEDAWRIEVDEMGWPTPLESDAWKLNIYIAGTGGSGPPSHGATAYYTHDDEGFPMIVVSDEIVPDRGFAAETAAHELNHALQDGAQTYDYTGASAWYWEATAVWMAGLVHPESDTWPKLLFGWAFRPEVSLDHYQRPDGTVEGYHHYGAFIFLRHLSEVTADPSIIRRSWVEGGGAPLEVLDRLLAEQGSSLDATFADFSGRVATWDYADEELYRSWLDDRAQYFDSHVPTATLVVDGREKRASVPVSRYGVQIWRLPAVADDVVLAFQGEESSRWAVTVARVDDGVHSRRRANGTITLQDLASADEAWVSVAAMASEGTDLRYTLSLGRLPEEIPDSPPEIPDGCACSNATGPGTWLFIVALARTVCCRRRR